MFDFLDNCKGFLPKAIEGDLSPGELGRWEEHLRNCRSCAQQFESFQQQLAGAHHCLLSRIQSGYGNSILLIWPQSMPSNGQP